MRSADDDHAVLNAVESQLRTEDPQIIACFMAFNSVTRPVRPPGDWDQPSADEIMTIRRFAPVPACCPTSHHRLHAGRHHRRNLDVAADGPAEHLKPATDRASHGKAENMTEAHPADGCIAVIIPTYNERDNIHPITERVLSAIPEADLFIIDDNSPDGTGKIADARGRRRAHSRRAPQRQGRPGDGLPRGLRGGAGSGLPHHRGDRRGLLASAGRTAEAAARAAPPPMLSSARDGFPAVWR